MEKHESICVTSLSKFGPKSRFVDSVSVLHDLLFKGFVKAVLSLNVKISLVFLGDPNCYVFYVFQWLYFNFKSKQFKLYTVVHAFDGETSINLIG